MEANISFYVATAIFVVTYLLIIFDVFHQTVAALIGAVAMVLAGTYFGFLTWEEAILAIDFEVIGLLLGMMIIVSVIAYTGVFQWLSVKILKKSKGNLFVILVLFSLLTSFISMILDNVTTVLLTLPTLIEIAHIAKIDPKMIMLAVAFISDIGGAATIVGDPTSVLIGTHAGLSFNDFIIYNGKPATMPIVVFVIFISLIYFHFVAKKNLKTVKIDEEHLEKLSEKNLIKDKKLLIKSLFVLMLLVFMFIFQRRIGLNIATIALSGAALLLILIGRKRLTIEEVLEYVEWPTLLFFAFIFVVVKGAENVGLIDKLAMFIASFIKGNTILAITFIMWFLALISGFVNNVPLVMAMLPLIDKISATSGIDPIPLFWALLLGAVFGGNASMIGSSANIVVVGLAEKFGHPISSMEFMKHGIPYTLFSTFLAYILLIAFWG